MPNRKPITSASGSIEMSDHTTIELTTDQRGACLRRYTRAAAIPTAM